MTEILRMQIAERRVPDQWSAGRFLRGAAQSAAVGDDQGLIVPDVAVQKIDAAALVMALGKAAPSVRGVYRVKVISAFQTFTEDTVEHEDGGVGVVNRRQFWHPGIRVGIG